jgi:GH24 family phage-related lysozyme (muramidase)
MSLDLRLAAMLLPSANAEVIMRTTEAGSSGKPRCLSYVNRAGQNCIGYGHVMFPREVLGMPMSFDRAIALMRKDLMDCRNQLQKLISSTLEQHHLDALCCWTMDAMHGCVTHIQGEDWATSTLLRLVNDEEFVLASAELLNWAVIRGKLDSKALRRRQMEKKLFATAEL